MQVGRKVLELAALVAVSLPGIASGTAAASARSTIVLENCNETADWAEKVVCRAANEFALPNRRLTSEDRITVVHPDTGKVEKSGRASDVLAAYPDLT